MKITLATALLLCASVAFVKADWGYTDLEEEDEIETLEDELSELEPWETEDPAITPPKPPARLEQVLEELLKCFMEEGKGRMGRKCIKRFKEHLPPGTPSKKKVARCIAEGFKNCTKSPEDHGPLNCLLEFKKCLENMRGGEGSGNWF